MRIIKKLKKKIINEFYKYRKISNLEIFIQKFIHILLRSKFNKNFNRLLIFSNNYFSLIELINLIELILFNSIQ